MTSLHRRSKFVLLDRDGVINQKILGGYVTSWEQFAFLPKTLASLRLLTRNNYSIIVVSNQACVAKGLMSNLQLRRLTDRWTRIVERRGGKIEAVYYCTHRAEDGCACRKPRPGLLHKARKAHGFSFSKTFLIGDSESDLLAAYQVGCPAILISHSTSLSFEGLPHRPRAVVRDLFEASRHVIRGG